MTKVYVHMYAKILLAKFFRFLPSDHLTSLSSIAILFEFFKHCFWIITDVIYSAKS
jgi:hypothetical protein